MSSHSLNEQMNNELSQLLRVHAELDTTNIQFEVDDGNVSLVGSVPEDEMRGLVEDLISHSPGVRRVVNYLLIKRDETIFP